MKWIKILSYIFLILAIVLALMFFWLRIKHEQIQTAYNKEQGWKARVEHAHTQSYLHHYAEAEAEYRSLLVIRPDANDIKIDLASILYYQKRYYEALEVLNTIPREGWNERVRGLLADIYLSLNDYSHAENLYREYSHQFPNDLNATLKLARLLSWEKKYGEAIQLYQQLLAQDPNNVQIRRQYARILIWMGRKEEASEELKKTLPHEEQEPVEQGKQE